MITKDTTYKVKGIAIILIILFHSSTAPYNWINCNILHNMGVANVYLFLVLSGYGLSKSYQRDILLKGYWQKRFRNVIGLYMCITLIYIIIFKRTLSIGVIALNIIGMDFSRQVDGTMWYITVMLIWYICYWIIYKSSLNQYVKSCLILAIGMVMWKQSLPSPYGGISWQMNICAFAFPCGVLMGEFESGIRLINKKLLVCITIIGLISIGVVFGGGIFAKNTDFYLRVYSFIYSAVMISIVSLLERKNIKLKALYYIGGISYELYLWEGKLFSQINILECDVEIKCVIFISVIVIVSGLTHWSWNKIGEIKN